MFDFDIDSYISLSLFKDLTGLDIQNFTACRDFIESNTLLKLSILNGENH